MYNSSVSFLVCGWCEITSSIVVQNWWDFKSGQVQLTAPQMGRLHVKKITSTYTDVISETCTTLRDWWFTKKKALKIASNIDKLNEIFYSNKN